MFAAYVDTMGIQFQEHREFCGIEGIIFIVVVSSSGARATRKPSLGIKATGRVIPFSARLDRANVQGLFHP